MRDSCIALPATPASTNGRTFCPVWLHGPHLVFCSFFEDYKQLESKIVKVDDILGAEEARKTISEAMVRRPVLSLHSVWSLPRASSQACSMCTADTVGVGAGSLRQGVLAQEETMTTRPFTASVLRSRQAARSQNAGACIPS